MKNAINNNILSLNEKSPAEVQRELASRVRQRRLELDFTQKAFALRCGIPLPTYRRFETTGEISLHNLLLVAVPLRMLGDFEGVFSEMRYRSLADVADEEAVKKRKRGRRND